MTELPDLDPQDHRPVHAQIAETLRNVINTELSAGDRVPGENTIRTRYGVSQWTAREALDILEADQVITKIPKVGTFARDHRHLIRKPRRYRRQKTTGEFATDAKAAGLNPDIQADSKRVPANEEVAHRLHIHRGDLVIQTDYLFFADGRPIQSSQSFEPTALTVGTSVELPEEGPLAGTGVITRMDSIGLHIQHVTEEVSIRPPSKHEAETLAIPKGVHVFHVERTFETPDRPVETAEITIPGDRYSLVYRFNVTDDDDPTTSGTNEFMPLPATKPEASPVVASIVTSNHGVLIGQRNDGKPPWTFIAGEIEPGESPADAAIREVKEETGLLVMASTHEIGRRVHPKTGRTMIYLACKPVNDSKTDIFVGDEEELAAVHWVTLGHLRTLMPEIYPPVHEYLQQQFT